MKTMTILRSTLGLAAILCATLGTGITAEASSLSAITGQAQNPADYGCFENSSQYNYGSITNVCGSTETFCVPLLSSSSGHTVEITLYAPDINHDLQCYALSTTSSGGMYEYSGWYPAPQLGTDVQLVLPSTNVPSEGGLYACCSMAPTSRIDTIQF